jgi:hypothetical protein
LLNQAYKSESESLAYSLWRPVTIIGSLIFAVFLVFGAAIVRRHRELREAPTTEEYVRIDGTRSRVSTEVLVDGTEVDPMNLKTIFAESGEKVPRNSDGTFTLNDSETYYLFRSSTFHFSIYNRVFE